MKIQLHISLALIGAFLLAIGASAQTPVYLKINHYLGADKFALNNSAKTPSGDKIKISRLEYYISGIKLIHDGGKEISLDSVFILENAATDITHSLGVQNIGKLEKLKFSIGVDNKPNVNPNDPSNKTNNHANPALWASNHPLSPKFPSMHWGWASGYRFVALEGKSGFQFGQSFEIHALGDKNYFEVEIPLLRDTVNGRLDIVINADYTQGLTSIDVSRGLIEHSESGDAALLLKNFQNFVFNESTISTGLKRTYEKRDFRIVPNPSKMDSYLHFRSVDSEDLSLTIFDINGRLVLNQELNDSRQKSRISISEPGIYIVQVKEHGRVVYSDRLVITP